MTKFTRLVSLLIAGVCCISLAASAFAQDKAPAMSLDEAFTLLAKYDFGQPRMCQTVVDEYVRSLTASADKEKAAARLLPLLGGAASKETKRFVCRELVYVGSVESVPTLAALLADDDLSDMARFALERMNVPAVDDVFREALLKSKGNSQIGIINSIGIRRDAKAVEMLTKILSGADAAAARAAAGALGKIGGVDAANALSQARAAAKGDLRQAVVDAWLLCADRFAADTKTDRAASISIYAALQSPEELLAVRVAAMRGQATVEGIAAAPAMLNALKSATELQIRLAAQGLLQELPDPKVNECIISAMKDSLPAVQATLLEILALRGDGAAENAVIEAVGSADAQVRVAALRTLARVGGTRSVSVLVASAGGADADVARQSLAMLRGKDIEPAMIAMLAKADAKSRVEILRALTARHAADGPATFLACAMDGDGAVREAAVNGLGACAGEKDLPAVLAILAKSTSDNDRDTSEKAVASICQRVDVADKTTGPVLAAMKGADVNVRCALLRVLGGIGGEKALETVRVAMKDGDVKIQDTAVRTLADWSDASPMQDVLSIAKTTSNKVYRKRTFDGYVRMVNRTDRGPGDKVKLLQAALAIAVNPDEKRQVLSGLGEAACPAGLKQAAVLLEDESVKEEACVAVVNIAQKLPRLNAEDAAALKKVVEAARSKSLANKAHAILQKAGKP